MRMMNAIISLEGLCQVARKSDTVSNSECVYTFHSPYTSEKGILVNLSSFIGTVEEMTFYSSSPIYDCSQTGLFVRIVQKKVLMIIDEQVAIDNSPQKKLPLSKQGIESNGTFVLEETNYHTHSDYSIVAMSSNKENGVRILAEIPYTVGSANSFPTSVIESVESIIHHTSLTTHNDVVACELNEDKKPISKYAYTLKFVPNGVTISPNSNDWKCQKSGERENLWLNLSDGFIGGGRKNWDGSGGSNGALDHFIETGDKYPLVVKLGTITSDPSTADCFSYACDENCMVFIPNLKELLMKRGIHVDNLQKIAKTTTELEVELNSTYAFHEITESNNKLVRVSGPGLQGLRNIGNSCYINSIVQMCFSGIIPELSSRYGIIPNGDITKHPLLRISPVKASSDILCQTAKVACALTSGTFAYHIPISSSINMSDDKKTVPSTIDPKYFLSPRMFKYVITNNHAEFHSNQQQDAAQFLLHLFEILDCAETGSEGRIINKSTFLLNTDKSLDSRISLTSELFSFRTISRLVCTLDNRVKYKENPTETILSLRIPMPTVNINEEKMTSVSQDSSSESNDTFLHEPTEKRLKSQDITEDIIHVDDKSPNRHHKSNENSKMRKFVPTVLFRDCLEEWSAVHNIDDLRWPHLDNTVSSATEEIRFHNFPRYLIVQMQRYELGLDWTPRKLDVNIDMPEEIDLTKWRSNGPLHDEHLIPECLSDTDEDVISQCNQNDIVNEVAAPSYPTLDDNAVGKLMEMGINLNICRRALSTVGGSNVEDAMNWIFEHNNISNLNEPFPERPDSPSTEGDNTSTSCNEENNVVNERTVISLVESLECFTTEQVRAALIINGGSPDLTADWLFSHSNDLDGAIQQHTSISSSSSSVEVQLEDGEGKYSLIGLVSHIGQNTNSGHYVAHLKKCGEWIMFNDEQVVLSETPPIKHAYLYLFRRIDSLETPNSKY